MEEPNEISNEHQLWVNLSALGEGNVFAILPDLIRKMLAEGNLTDYEDEEFYDIVLPSDPEWRGKVYFQMVERQRLALENVMDGLEPEGVAKLHYWNIIPQINKKKFCPPEVAKLASRQTVHEPGPITWTVNDIANAGRLLAIPPMNTHFDDEQEMRRVYTLIYDVFRYKNILSQALKDAEFFYICSGLKERKPRIWLLLYDLYHRSFRKRDPANEELAKKLFQSCYLTAAENALWKLRIRLAASVARLRIQNSALRLHELLPKHLRDERITCQADTAPVMCWVNTKKIKNFEEINSTVEKMLNLKSVDETKNLGPGNYKWDNLCPQFILFHCSMRQQLAQSALVRKHKLVVQDRSFCLGPATFNKIISNLQLTGSVIQSHVNSPRSTAYLATLLAQNDNINSLMAFSAGNRKEEYEEYLSNLGMTNVAIFEERLIDIPTDANYLNEVIAVFATPPNSYSAVVDPIDLVCSRGGDLSMLEILTESESTSEGKQRVANILDEQKKTLRFAMSRPQIQLVLYETHSELDAENDGMVEKTIKEINKIAKMRHAVLQGKLKYSTASDLMVSEVNNNERIMKIEIADMIDKESAMSLVSKRQSNMSAFSLESSDTEERFYKDVVVPDCDLFDVPKLPDLCPNADACLKLSKEGCYLALLQRKQVTRLDNKYMIQLAESRGVFGNASTTGRVKGGKGARTKKQDKRAASPPTKIRRKVKPSEIARIAAPTHASMRHSHLGHEAVCLGHCPKNKPNEELISKVPQSRLWWSETTQHLSNLRISLVKQKLLPPIRSSSSPQAHSKMFANTLLHTKYRIDEIVCNNNHNNSNIPVFPRLRLTRNIHKKDKVPLPVSVTVVEFPIRPKHF